MCLLIKSRSFYLPAVEDKTPYPPQAPSPLPVTSAIHRHVEGCGLGGAKVCLSFPFLLSWFWCLLHSQHPGWLWLWLAGSGPLEPAQEDNGQLGFISSIIQGILSNFTASVCHIMRDPLPAHKKPSLPSLLSFLPLGETEKNFLTGKIPKSHLK